MIASWASDGDRDDADKAMLTWEFVVGDTGLEPMTSAV